MSKVQVSAAVASTEPAVVGVSLLEALGAPLEHAGHENMFAFGRVVLQCTTAGQITIASHEDGGDESVVMQKTLLGRQRALWEAIPSLRTVVDNTKVIKAAAVGLVVDANGAVLITRRAATMRSYPGCWVLPGGAVDPGESLTAAALREVEEETGLSLEVSTALHPVAMWESAFPLTVDTYKAAGCTLKAHMLMVAYAIQLDVVAPPLRLQPAEVDVCVWLPQDRLRELLGFTLTAEHPPAATLPPAGSPAAPGPCAVVAPQQLMGVYPNDQSPPEGLGLAHHFVIGRWLADGAKTVPAKLRSDAPAAAN